MTASSKWIARFITLAALLGHVSLDPSIAEDHVFSYHDGIPSNSIAAFDQGLGGWGLFPWVGVDPYSDDNVPENYYRVIGVDFYHGSLGYSGPWEYKLQIVFIGYGLPSVIYETETFQTNCDDCWESVPIDISLLELGYNPYPHEVGVIVVPLSVTETRSPRPLLFVDQDLDHPLSTAYVSSIFGYLLYVEELNEMYGTDFGDILLDIHFNEDWTTSTHSVSFSEIRRKY
ncbi:hypothetical protein H8E52_00900 [bacterium]|nr:hypothetical protein [bacterium]